MFISKKVIETDMVGGPPEIVFRMTRVKRLLVRKVRLEVNGDEETPF